METFSAWLSKAKPPIPAALTAYKGGSARDNAIPHAEMQTLLTSYYRDVVAPTRGFLSFPALLLFDAEFDRIRHDKGNSLAAFTEKLDQFARRHDGNWGEGRIIKPSEVQATLPDMALHIPKGTAVGRDLSNKQSGRTTASYHGQRFVKYSETPYTDGPSGIPLYGRLSGPDTAPVKPIGPLVVHDGCRSDFARGLPGTSWVGIAQIAARSNAPRDVVYLVPSAPVMSHLTDEHAAGLQIDPVVHGEVSSHNGALAALVNKGWISLGETDWNGYSWVEIQKNNGYNETGIFFGFSVVKAFSSRGHLYAFTSVTLNKYACADHGTGPAAAGVDAISPSQILAMKRAGTMSLGNLNTTRGRSLGAASSSATDVAKDWAVEIWKATRNLS